MQHVAPAPHPSATFNSQPSIPTFPQKNPPPRQAEDFGNMWFAVVTLYTCANFDDYRAIIDEYTEIYGVARATLNRPTRTLT